MHTLWQLRKEGLISEEQKGEIKDLMILNASFVLQMYSEFVQKGVCCLRELILRHLKGEKDIALQFDESEYQDDDQFSTIDGGTTKFFGRKKSMSCSGFSQWECQ